MTQHQPPDSKISTIVRVVSLVTAITLLLSNFSFLLLSSREFRIDTIIFYWQQFTKYWTWIYVLTCILPPVFMIIWAINSIKQIRSLRFHVIIITGSLLVGACLFINYMGVFVLSMTSHMETVKLHDNVYQLAKVEKYDDERVYYLGKCDRTGYWCSFHDIYRSHLTADTGKIQLDENAQRLLVRVNGKTVYTYDGVSEYCKDSEGGYCPQRLR